jgi:hypothetical protein
MAGRHSGIRVLLCVGQGATRVASTRQTLWHRRPAGAHLMCERVSGWKGGGEAREDTQREREREREGERERERKWYGR